MFRSPKEYYEALYKAYGPQNWWPCEGEKYGNDEIAVGAILTQNTSWKNVEKAIGNLREEGALSLEAIATIDIDKLSDLIRPAGFYNQKAMTLKRFSHFMVQNFGSLKHFFEHQENVLALRDILLSIKGIGKETADSILLYAGFKPIFVVDKYTFRAFNHYGIISMERFNYDVIRIMVEKEIKDVYDMQEFHALIVKDGKEEFKLSSR